jgi:hypothetical protein
MNRRAFLKTGLAVVAATPTIFGWASLSLGEETRSQADLHSLFASDDPKLVQLAAEIMQKCVLNNIQAPKGPLKHTWITAGGGYLGQWLWDPMFIVDILSVFPDRKQTIRDMFQNYWDFQVEWNAQRPEYARDMLPCMILPSGGEVPYSQIPILAWGLERVFRRNHDLELIEHCLGPLERFHEWYWRERDVTNIGLVAVGSYPKSTGGAVDVQWARFETFDFECNMDDLKLTTHPTRKAGDNGKWYGDLCLPGNTAYLLLAENSLMRLAETAGDKEMALRRKVKIDKCVAAMRAHMWDEEAGCFLTVHRDTLKKVPVATIGSWIGLMAGAPTEAMAKRMAEVIQGDHWNTPLPVPTVDRQDKRWDPNGMWRGDVWPATNYQIATGLARYGHKEQAAAIADITVTNALKNGVFECYNSMSGVGRGVSMLGMSCTILTMMLDGLTSKCKLQCK